MQQSLHAVSYTHLLEEALKIKDKYEDVTVTVISMGPPQAQDLLFECIAMGADEGILISDRAVGLSLIHI